MIEQPAVSASRTSSSGRSPSGESSSGNLTQRSGLRIEAPTSRNLLHQMASSRAALLCLMGLLQLATHTAGQGFRASETGVVGASDSYTQLQQLYSKSRSWRNAYKLSPVSACSRSRSGSLCAAAAADTADAYAQLMLAASPQAYSTLDPKYAGGVRLIAAPLDQQACDTCSAMAIASAAETAVATVNRVDVDACSISVQALHFCPPGNQPGRRCKGGWSLSSTLSLLQQYSQQLPTEACMPYRSDLRGDLSYDQLCSSSCTAPNVFASQGMFNSFQITTVWEAQQQIRLYGGVVTRFDIYDDFRPFFANYANVQAIYKPKPGAKMVQGHAVVLVGYNNDQQYWIAKNSWGPDWADNGFFKVSYGVCSILTPDTGEAYGISWEQKPPPPGAKLNLLPGPKTGCYWYQASSGDYMSKIAWLAGVALDRFVMDNVAYVKDLDATLAGIKLLVCNPRAGVSTKPSPAPAAPATTTRSVKSNISDAQMKQQLEALLGIRAALDPNSVLAGWNRPAGKDGGYCDWRGVCCCSGTKTVQRLSMWYGAGIDGLRGTLPSAALLRGLPDLIYLAISSQPGVSGTLPEDWSTMTQLQYIAANNNSLSGTIPSSYANLQKLTAFYAWGSGLSGTLPSSFSRLKALTVLAVSTNKLSGSIPAWLGELRNLRTLKIFEYSSEGHIPDTLGQLRNLESLELYSNGLSGPIPVSFGGLSKLKVLNLFDNSLTGTLPSSLGQLTQLEDLRISKNGLSGTLPASYSKMTSLKGFYSWGNPMLQGCLPLSWRDQLNVSSVWSNLLDKTQLKGFC